MKPRTQRKNILKARLTERLAGIVLFCKGYSIVSFNQKFAGVEVDILAKKKNQLIVVEVKYRKDAELRLEAVSGMQIHRLQKACWALEAKYNLSVRLDFMLFTPTRPFMQHFKGV